MRRIVGIATSVRVIVSLVASIIVGQPVLSQQAPIEFQYQWPDQLLALADTRPPALPEYMDVITVDVPVERVVDADQQVQDDGPRVFGGDANFKWDGNHVILADYKQLLRIPAPPRAPGLIPTGTTVSFSSQGSAAVQAATGKGLTDFQLIAPTICRWTPGPPFMFGIVIQLANSIGIQTITKDNGTNIVQQRVARNFKTLAPRVGAFVLAAFAGLSVGGILPGALSSVGWQRGLVFGHLLIDGAPALFGPTGPFPDPFLRNVVDVNTKIDLQPGECAPPIQFSGVYNGPGSNFTSDRLQLLP